MDKPGTLLDPLRAEAIAEANQADDDRESDGWTYQTRAVGRYAVIDVYDEQGDYVGTL